MIKGHVDNINNYCIKGWCYDVAEPLKCVNIRVYIDNELIVESIANDYRKDLENVVHPTGNCGFSISIKKEICYKGQELLIYSNGEVLNSRFNAFLDVQQNIIRFQLYGERASGTNYLTQLLLNNLYNVYNTSNYGWKHFFPPEYFPKSNNCLFLIIYRNVYDWLRSIYSNSHHVHSSLKNISFSQFIRSEWCCIWDETSNVFPNNEKYHLEMLFERNPENGKRFRNILELRTSKIKALESLRAKVRNIHFLKYEDVVNNPEYIIEILSQKYELPKRPYFKQVSQYKGMSDTIYIPKIYNDISSEDLKFINSNVDAEIEKQIGYSMQKMF